MTELNDAIAFAETIVNDDRGYYWIKDSQWLLAIGLLHLSKQATSLDAASDLFAENPPDLDSMDFDQQAGDLVLHFWTLRSRCPKQFSIALTHAVMCCRKTRGTKTTTG